VGVKPQIKKVKVKIKDRFIYHYHYVVLATGETLRVPRIEIKNDKLAIYAPYQQDFINELKYETITRTWRNDYWEVSMLEATIAIDIVKKHWPRIKDVPEVDDLSTMPLGSLNISGNQFIIIDYHGINCPKFRTELQNVFSRTFYSKGNWTINIINKNVLKIIIGFCNKFRIAISRKIKDEIQFRLDEYNLNKEKRKEFMEASKATRSADAIDIPKLGGTLYPFQSAGVRYIDKTRGRALIGDEMGLGKTIISLAWTQLHNEQTPVIVVCPASLKNNWAREILKWTEADKVIIINGSTNIRSITKDDFKGKIIKGDTPLMGHRYIILNYEMVSKWKDKILEIDPKCIILDECHYIKNYKAKRTISTIDLAKSIPHQIALSGTPMLNKPIELWTTVNLLSPTVFDNFMDFAYTYCSANRGGYGWDFNGASNLNELHVKLAENCMLRRLKKDVLDELPAKTRNTIILGMGGDGERQYNKAYHNLLDFLIEEKKKTKKQADRSMTAEVLVRIGALRQTIAKAKLPAAREWLHNALDSGMEKVVVFVHHHDTVDALYEEFKDIAVKVTGHESINDRDSNVQAFQMNDDIRMLIGTFGAAGIGLTMTAASDVVMLELPWRPSDLTQAEDRLHRIGQEKKVTAWYLLASDTIDEYMADLLERKMAIASQVLDGTSDEVVENLKGEFIKMLMDKAEE